MNNLLLCTGSLIIGSLLLSSCGDNSSFETQSTDGAVKNEGTVSQKNFSVLADDPTPLVFDAATNTINDTSVTIIVKVGDSNNQLLTSSHTVHFATEWGLIEPSCTTVDSTCSVTWQTSFGSSTNTPVPTDHLTTITAYTLGEEDYSDTNGDGIFDDSDQPFPSGDLFSDTEEPFVDSDAGTSTGGTFGAGDTIIDVINGNVLGKNGVHDLADGLLNSPNCTHSSLCSTVMPITYIWTDIVLDLDGPPDTTTP